MSPEQIKERYEAMKERAPGVTIVAATKYVALEQMSVLAEAGVEWWGKTAHQDIEAKHAHFAGAFRWHFISHLQSRKAKTVNETSSSVLRSRPSAARRLRIPALVEVNLAGEETKSGIAERPRRVPRPPIPTCAG